MEVACLRTPGVDHGRGTQRRSLLGCLSSRSIVPRHLSPPNDSSLMANMPAVTRAYPGNPPSFLGLETIHPYAGYFLRGPVIERFLWRTTKTRPARASCIEGPETHLSVGHPYNQPCSSWPLTIKLLCSTTITSLDSTVKLKMSTWLALNTLKAFRRKRSLLGRLTTTSSQSCGQCTSSTTSTVPT